MDDILLKENDLKRLIYKDRRHWLLYLSQTSWKRGKTSNYSWYFANALL